MPRRDATQQKTARKSNKPGTRRTQRVKRARRSTKKTPTVPEKHVTIGLLAHRSLRDGPNSLLMRFLREFEPFIRNVLEAHLVAVGGTYRAIRRYGLFRDYGRLETVEPGHEGGIVPLTAMVVRGDPNTLDPIIVYLQDPRDPTSTYPESIALKRECVVARKPFFATYSAAFDWASLSWFARDNAASELYFLDSELQRALEKRRLLEKTKLENQTIALIAHDRKKLELMSFVRENLDLLHRFSECTATGTTGELLNGRKPKRFSRREWGEILPEFRRLKAALKERALKDWVNPEASGPRGGDVGIANRVLSGHCDRVIFFEDPHVSREHEADIQLLERTCRIPEKNIMCLHDYSTATEWARTLKKCRKKCRKLGVPVPITLQQAFRLLYKVELVLARLDTDANEDQDVWNAMLEQAAFFLLGEIVQRAAERATIQESVRVAVTWGVSMHDLVNKVEEVAAELLQQEPGAPEAERLIEVHALRPENVITLPMVGLIGSTDPRVEANQNAKHLRSVFPKAGYVPLSACAFLRTPFDENPTALEKEWNATDLAVFTCDKVKPHLGRAPFAPLPATLLEQMRDSAAAEVGGMFLNSQGAEITPRGIARVGMDIDQIKRVKALNGTVLIAGIQSSRLDPSLACLRGELVSTFITNRSFAWEILRRDLGVTAEKKVGVSG